MRTLSFAKTQRSGKRRLLRKQVAAVVLLASVSGCAFSEKPVDPWTRDKDAVLAAIKEGQAEREALGQQIQELTRQIIKLQQAGKKQSAQLTAMEASLQALREKQSKLIIGDKQRKAREKKAVQQGAHLVTSGSSGAPNSTQKTLKEKIAAVERDLDRTLKQTAINKSGPETATEPPATTKPVSSAADLTAAGHPLDPAAEKNSYSAAYLSLKSGRFEEASKQFLAHLKKFPQGNLTDQALYWLGESFLAQQRDREALKAMKQLVRDYPRSGKYGAALLRIASVYERQGRKGDAKAAYLQLIQTQPNSTSAERARTRLAELK